MKGYRTLVAHGALTVLGVVVALVMPRLPPEVQVAVTTVYAAGAGFVGVVMRVLTKTPVGQAAEAAVERWTGLTQADLDAVMQKYGTATSPDLSGVIQQGAAVEAAVKELAAALQAPPAPVPAAPPAGPGPTP